MLGDPGVKVPQPMSSLDPPRFSVPGTIDVRNDLQIGIRCVWTVASVVSEPRPAQYRQVKALLCEP